MVSCFNPRLPGGRRPPSSRPRLVARCFNPRLPGGRRLRSPGLWGGVGNVSIHAFRGEGDFGNIDNPRCFGVSIHAFRGEGDPGASQASASTAAFQSTPSGGKATVSVVSVTFALKFQSTPSGGKATRVADARRATDIRFNPRLPGGRRHARVQPQQPAFDVSIHAFRGEGDRPPPTRVRSMLRFQSTPSGGKATTLTETALSVLRVSIHAFRGEGDQRG